MITWKQVEKNLEKGTRRRALWRARAGGEIKQVPVIQGFHKAQEKVQLYPAEWGSPRGDLAS